MQGMTSLLNRIAVACLALALAGCATPKTEEAAKSSAASSGPTKEFQMRGEVTGLDAGGHVATIKHEAIQGFMGAMTMGYPVKDPAEFSKLAVGEPITATVYQSGDDFWIGNIQKSVK
jgi:Cu/Ag efflux protein CusF